jgi:hypothetical protein
MPRRPKMRVSYYDDAQFLLRLGNAILRDTKRPEEWRNKMDNLIRHLAMELMGVPSISTEPKPVPMSGGSRKKVS